MHFWIIISHVCSIFDCILQSLWYISFSDCCQLLGKELGREWLLPYCSRGQWVRDWNICDWRVGQDHYGGHAQPSSPPSSSTHLETSLFSSHCRVGCYPWGKHTKRTLITSPCIPSWQGESQNQTHSPCALFFYTLRFSEDQYNPYSPPSLSFK